MLHIWYSYRIITMAIFSRKNCFTTVVNFVNLIDVCF